ncbi:hypothetical protein M5689_015680 [Euphorbia peplus]|nr:hypothetical protein M5689_015680 [Euphorbia peplus]
MRSLATCYSDHAIKVSDSYCSSSRYSNQSHFSPISKPSILNSVANIYQIKSQDHIFFITLTWSNKLFNHGFSISVADSKNLTQTPQFLRKIKGSKTLIFPSNSNSPKLDLIWDLSSAVYDVVSPEPVTKFYVVVLVNSQRVLLIGDETEPQSATVSSKLVSRIAQFSGNSEYSTRAQFSDSGIVHDILIKCNGEDEERSNSRNSKSPVLIVNIDNKKMFEIKRLKWNFRGNQIIFLDGLLIDMMWDLHDWFFKVSGGGYGVFMFRTRSGLDSRLWLEEKDLGLKQTDFSLFICACNNPG